MALDMKPSPSKNIGGLRKLQLGFVGVSFKRFLKGFYKGCYKDLRFRSFNNSKRVLGFLYYNHNKEHPAIVLVII